MCSLMHATELATTGINMYDNLWDNGWKSVPDCGTTVAEASLILGRRRPSRPTLWDEDFKSVPDCGTTAPKRSQIVRRRGQIGPRLRDDGGKSVPDCGTIAANRSQILGQPLNRPSLWVASDEEVPVFRMTGAERCPSTGWRRMNRHSSQNDSCLIVGVFLTCSGLESQLKPETFRKRCQSCSSARLITRRR